MCIEKRLARSPAKDKRGLGGCFGLRTRTRRHADRPQAGLRRHAGARVKQVMALGLAPVSSACGPRPKWRLLRDGAAPSSDRPSAALRSASLPGPAAHGHCPIAARIDQGRIDPHRTQVCESRVDGHSFGNAAEVHTGTGRQRQGEVVASATICRQPPPGVGASSSGGTPSATSENVRSYPRRTICCCSVEK